MDGDAFLRRRRPTRDTKGGGRRKAITARFNEGSRGCSGGGGRVDYEGAGVMEPQLGASLKESFMRQVCVPVLFLLRQSSFRSFNVAGQCLIWRGGLFPFASSSE